MAKKQAGTDAQKTPKTYLRASSSDRKPYPVRLTPENYEVVKSWSDTSGESMNSLFNGMVQTFAAVSTTSSSPETVQESLGDFIKRLGEPSADSNKEEDYGKESRKRKGKAKD